MAEIVASTISSKLNFSVHQLLANTDAVIFGGAPRDAVAKMPIQDIDIAGFENSMQVIKKRLDSFGFDELPMDDAVFYPNRIARVISYEKNGLKIDLIKPTKDRCVQGILEFVSNVDISCCGLLFYIDRKGVGLLDTIELALDHAANRKFKILDTDMVTSRTTSRAIKLCERGWTQEKTESNDTESEEFFDYRGVS